MSYDYQTERAKIFTEEGQKLFLEVRDRTKLLLATQLTITIESAMKGSCGSSWEILACVDRMIELGEVVRVTNPKSTATQHQLLMKG